MRPTLVRLTSSQFQESTATTLFNPADSRCYGLADFGQHSFKFSWHSELVEPELLSDEKRIGGVGIDLMFALFDFQDNLFLKQIELQTFFMRSILTGGDIFIFCEMEAIRLDRQEFNVIQRYSFPDVFESLDGEPDRLIVECMDGSEVIIPI